MFERFTADARHVVVEAVNQAEALGHRQVLPAHVLLALVVQGDQVLLDAGFTPDQVRTALNGEPTTQEDDAEALRALGIDLNAVKAAIDEQFGPGAWDEADAAPRRGFGRGPWGRHSRFDRSSKKLLELSLREAIAHKDRRIRSEYIVLGLLRGADPTVLQIVSSTIEPAELRRRVEEALRNAA